jgi:hypothetical protein
MDIKIEKATVVLNVGADHCMLHTNLPSPFPKVTEQNLILEFSTEYDKGVEYVRKVFGIEPEIIKRTGRT